MSNSTVSHQRSAAKPYRCPTCRHRLYPRAKRIHQCKGVAR